MAFRTWSRLLLTALGVSLLAGAGQLGLAYGFGILRLTGSFTGVTVNQWPAQLVWVGWCAANAAVVGAVLTERIARRDHPLTGTGRQLAVAAAAALGATVVAPLCMQPARAAELVSVDPVWAVGICAVLGAVVGAGAALAVLVKPPVGWNMAAVAGVLWLLALLSVAPSLATTGQLPMARLGVFEPAWLDADAAQRLAMLVLPTTALLAGAATGAAARWRGHPPLVAGATGVAGPVLVAFAYLTAGPGDVIDRYQLAPYYGALLAVAAGALGSAAAALARWPLGAHAAGTPAPGTPAIEPTDILRPLPAGPDLPTAGAPAEAGSARTEPVAEPAGADLAARSTGTDAIGTVPTAGGSTGRAAPAHWDWLAASPTGELPPRTGDHPSTRDTTTDALTTPGTGQAGGAAPAPAPRTASPDRPAERPATSTEPTTFPTTPGAPVGSTRGAARSTSPAEPTPATATSAAAEPTDPAAAAGPASDAHPEPVPAEDAAEQARGTGKARSSRPTGTPAASRTSRRPAAAAPHDESVAAEPADGAAGAAEQPAPRPRRARKSKAATKRTGPTAPATPAAAAAEPAAPGSASAGPEPAAGSAATADRDAPTAARTADAAPAHAGNTGTPTPAAAAAVPPVTTTVDSTAAPTVPVVDATGAPAAKAPAPEVGERHGATPEPARPVFRPVPEPATPTPERPAAPRSTWPVAPAWSAPPRPAPAVRGEATGPAPAEETPEPGRRPRHRAPLPDLDRAASWEALATARRAGPVPPADGASPDGSTPDAAADDPAGTPADADPEPAPTGTEQNGGRLRGRLGLFRRNRARTGEESPDAADDEPLPAQDEEYVDWVAGLGRPLADNEPEQETGRRSLRSTGRHHRD